MDMSLVSDVEIINRLVNLIVVLITGAVFFLGSYVNSYLRYNGYKITGNIISLAMDLAIITYLHSKGLGASAVNGYGLVLLFRILILVDYWNMYDDLYMKKESKFEYAKKHCFFKWMAEHHLIPGYYTR